MSVTIGAVDLSSVPGVTKLSSQSEKQEHRGSYVTVKAIAWYQHPEFDLMRIRHDIGLVQIPPVDKTPGDFFLVDWTGKR